MAIVVLPGHAWGRAPTPGVTIAPISVRGELTPGSREQLQHSLDEAAAAHHATVAGTDAPASEDPPCRASSCMAKLASELDAMLVMTVDLTVDGRDYWVDVSLWDGSSGRKLLSSRRDCEICGVQEVAEMIAAETGTLLEKADTLERPAIVRVESEPGGATVSIDGNVVGTTPFEGELPAGRHTLALSKAGFAATPRVVEAKGGLTEHVDVRMNPVGRDRLRVAGGVLTGVGAALVVPGLTFAVLHHRPVGSRCDQGVIDVNGVCPYRYDSLPYGATMLAVGVAAVVAGVIMLGISAKRGRSRERVRAGLYANPLALGVRL